MAEINWDKISSNFSSAFGLDPKEAATGRRLQAETDLLGSKLLTEEAERGLIPHKQRVYQTEATSNEAKGKQYEAGAGKLQSEKTGIDFTNAARTRIADLVSTGKIVDDPQTGMWRRGPTATDAEVYALKGAFASLSEDPIKGVSALQSIGSIMAQDPLVGARARADAGSLVPTAVGTPEQARAMLDRKAAEEQALKQAELANRLEEQRIQNQGRLETERVANEGRVAAERERARAQGGPDFSKAVGVQADYEKQVLVNVPGAVPQVAAEIARQAIEIDRANAAAGRPVDPQKSIADVLSQMTGYRDPSEGRGMEDRKFGPGTELVPSRRVAPAAPATAQAAPQAQPQVVATQAPSTPTVASTVANAASPAAQPQVIQLPADRAEAERVYNSLPPGTPFITPEGLPAIKQ